jgi:GNAT superfamily N-acetyltransferase
MKTTYSLHRDRGITAREFGLLAALARWGEVEDFTEERLAGHFAAVDFVAYVRDGNGVCVGYVSAMANGMCAVFVDSLLTHPEYDREEVGGMLLHAVLEHFAGSPVYAMPFVDEQEVFLHRGFKIYRREMIALANRNDVSVKTKSTMV